MQVCVACLGDLGKGEDGRFGGARVERRQLGFASRDVPGRGWVRACLQRGRRRRLDGYGHGATDWAAARPAAIGEAPATTTPATLVAAHRYLFRLQERLLSRVPSRPQPGSEALASQVASIPLLALPPRHRVVTEAEWREQIRLTVQRAHDTARYLNAQEQAAARDPAGRDLAAQRHDQAERARQSFELLVSQAEHATGQALELDPEPAFPNGGQVQLENLVIDLDRGEVRQDDRLVSVMPVERACLVALAANPGRVLTREAMLHLVYDDDPRIDITSQALNVHLSHVRQKLGHPAWLATVAGIGFRAVTPQPIGESQSVGIDRVRQQRRQQRQAWARGSSAYPPPFPSSPAPAIERRPGR
jgi:DNA-binding winged helix-turn-helix (wHTH) protein